MMLLAAVLLSTSAFTQNKKELQATVDLLNTKIVEQEKTIESQQLQLTTHCQHNNCKSGKNH